MNKMKRLIILFGAMFLAGAMPSAKAEPIKVQIDDASEQLALYVLYPDGNRVSISPGRDSDGITNLTIDNNYQTVGERMQFDFKIRDMGPVSDDKVTPMPVVYTQLKAATDDFPFKISDEFLIMRTDPPGSFHVDFISLDSDGIMSSLHKAPPDPFEVPDPSAILSKVEIPNYQDVAYFLYPSADEQGKFTVEAIFQVMSVSCGTPKKLQTSVGEGPEFQCPEPPTLAIFLGGIGVMLMQRKRLKSRRTL